MIYSATILKRLLCLSLLATCYPMVSAAAQEQMRLEDISDQGAFLIEIIWTPGELRTDDKFLISFVEPVTGTVLEDIQYNFVVLEEEASDPKIRRVDQISAEQRIRFDKVGSYTVLIEDIEGLGENATFPIEVTPEFPLGVIIPVAAGTFIAIMVARHKGKNLSSQKG